VGQGGFVRGPIELSPTAISSAAAESSSTPFSPSRVGAVRSTMGPSYLPSATISPSNIAIRWARCRDAILHAAGGCTTGPGRRREQCVTSSGAAKPRRCSRNSAVAVLIRDVSGYTDCVRALIALWRATRSTRIIPPSSPRLFRTDVAVPPAAACATAYASNG